jgi:hypothetical protein
MAYSAQEQEIYDHAKASIPRFLFQKTTAPEDWIGGFVKIFDASRTQVDTWLAQAKILVAVGIWLEQHAKDRGTRRQAGESNPALRSRLRTIDDAVNVASLKNAATAALVADGVTIPAGYPAIVETRRDGAFMGTWASPAPGAFHPNYDGRKMAYLSRGYRMHGPRGSIIVILPYGTSDATAKSVYQACYQKKAAGFTLVVETRQNP